MREPILHTHITDCLEEDHPLAYEEVFCKTCDVMLHCFNNECMQSWFESGLGNFCYECFTKLLENPQVIHDDVGLKDNL